VLQRFLRIQGWLKSDRGQDLVEYALLGTLLALVCIAAIQFAGEAVSAVWNTLSTTLAGL